MLSSLLFASQYNVGDTISNQDVNQEFDVCFGQYQTSTFKLQDFQGKVIWLQFSASWWEPCLGFIPSGEEIEEYWKDNEDVAIIDFLDDIGQTFSCNTWGSFGNVEHPVIIDDLSYDFHDKFHADYAYPTNVFIDHNMIVYRVEAAMTITQINQTIQEMFCLLYTSDAADE